LNEIIKRFKAYWWEENEKRISKHVDIKMQDFDVVVAPKIEQKKWG